MTVANKIDATIGHRMRCARVATKLTQDDLAQRLGISSHHIQQYENGSTRVSASKLWAMGDVLHVPVTYFFESLKPNDILSGGEIDLTRISQMN